MNTNKQGRTPVFDSSFKIAVARDYLTGNLGYGTLAKKYDVASADTVRHFVKWYKQKYPDSLPAPQPAESELQDRPVNDKQLTNQLKEANLKIAGLEMLIETAQKELGIDIVKKPGSKQSHRGSTTILPQE